MAQLAAQDRKVGLLAVTKERGGANDRALLEFYTEFFERHPVYLDENWALYKAMGGRKIGGVKLVQRLLAAQARYIKKKIYHSEGNFKPEATKQNWMTGGVLVFNKQGGSDLCFGGKRGQTL